MGDTPLDSLPLWAILLILIGVGMVALEVGYQFGLWRRKRVTGEKEGPVSAMVGSLLALLAIMLAFTFNLAASRFDARRQAVLEESNAIGTTYLRARLLPEPERTEIEKLLHEYAELRSRINKEPTIDEIIDQSEVLQDRIWTLGVAAAARNPASIMTSIFLESLNDVIDVHSKRVLVGLRSRIPMSMWLVLFTLSILGLGSMGYQAGLTGTRRSPEMPILTIAFASVLFLIVDLDRAHEGLLQVSQQSMIDLLHTMKGH